MLLSVKSTIPEQVFESKPINLTTGGRDDEVQVQLIAKPVTTTLGSEDSRKVIEPTVELIVAGKL